MAEQKSKRTKDIGTPNVKASANAPLLALIRIRGQTKIRHDIYLTLHMFHLKKKLSCVLVTATPSMLGMIHKVKDYVTWGPIDSETHKLLLEKRQTFYTTPDGKKAPRPVFHLHPPRGGCK